MRVSLFNRKVIAHFDFVLIMLILPLAAMSLYLISEISQELAYKQMIYMTVACALFLVVFALPIRGFYWLIPVGYWFGIALLVLVDFAGVTQGMGAQRWLKLPLINLTIQPSETFKPFFVLMLAYLVREAPPGAKGYGWIELGKLSFYILLPFFLILREPDLGSATLLLLVGGGIIISVGLRRRIIVTLTIGAAVACALFYTVGYDMLHDYQKKRISDFLSEESNYHVQQSLIAIGNGGLYGKTSEESTQAQLKFLPIATSDFIFAYFVERFGFAGALGLFAIYVSIVLHLLSMNLKVNGDYLATVTITGTAIMIFLYMAINIAMTIGFAPVVGVPLPMFSHGGSSFVNFVVLVAIIENFLAFRFNFLYTSAPRSVKMGS